MNRFVYLDNNATTKVSQEIREMVMPYLDLQFGNPSSLYQHGAKVRQAIDDARKSVCKLIKCEEKHLIFTGSGSEANCTAFNSAIFQRENKRKIITTKVEHSSILEYYKLLEKRGFSIVYLDVDKNCQIDAKALERELDENTALLSIQYANNEVGAILLSSEIQKIIKDKKKKYDFMFHVDCVQVLGKIPINVKTLGVDFASFSGHKIHCPKGIGALYIKDTDGFVPLIAGHQEFGLRGGTENVVGIVAFGQSCKKLSKKMKDDYAFVTEMRDYLEKGLKKLGAHINCLNVDRLPNTTSVTFDTIDGNSLMFKLERQGICVSTGSACNSESSEPSYVLTSMRVKNPQNTIRISLDENTTKSQIDYFLDNLKQCL